MKRLLPFVAVIWLLSSPNVTLGQQAAAPVTAVLLKSLSTMAGATAIQDATLTGVSAVAGQADGEAIPFTFEGTSSGSTREDLSLASGVRSEVRINSAAGLSGTWSQAGGPLHPIAPHNLLTDSSWTCPGLFLARITTGQAFTVTLAGIQGNLIHFLVYQQLPAPPTTLAQSIQHLTQIDLYLDSTTFLPAQLSYNTHPDNDAGVDMPVEITFDGYQNMNGMLVPTHITKSVNNALQLDLQIQSATFNSGLTVSTLSAN